MSLRRKVPGHLGQASPEGSGFATQPQAISLQGGGLKLTPPGAAPAPSSSPRPPPPGWGCSPGSWEGAEVWDREPAVFQAEPGSPLPKCGALHTQFSPPAAPSPASSLPAPHLRAFREPPAWCPH